MMMSMFAMRACLMLLIAVALVLSGCDGDHTAHEHADGHDHDSHDHGSYEHDSHEGHDHGPGEHGLVVAPGSEGEEVSDWCAEHAVPESECTACHPELIGRFRASGDWCAGHGLPESHCRLCNPGIRFEQEEQLRARASELVEGELEIMLNFRPNAEVCATDGAIIQFASVATARRAGLRVSSVYSSEREEVLEAPAEVVFDETELSVVSSTVPALVSRWLVAPGEVVVRGTALAMVKSPAMAQLKSALLAAHAEYEVERKELERRQSLKAQEFISAAELDRQLALTEHARTRLTAARGLLLAAGLDSGDVAAVIEAGDLSHEFALRAPEAGMVVERMAKPGDLLAAGEAFAMIADPHAMWIEARLTERQLRWVTPGQQLTFSSDGRGMHRVGGEIIWISRFLDPHTRTGTVRARVVDSAHGLSAGEFGRVRVVQAHPESVTLVLKDAVQWEGCCNVVFVRETEDRYRPRKVQLYDSDGPYYQVSEGVRPGDQVVVDGAFLLKTELKKSSIGAGCCGLDPIG
jgi:cobalt-zinc-cadmium efflux system membrane fusion protein